MHVLKSCATITRLRFCNAPILLNSRKIAVIVVKITKSFTIELCLQKMQIELQATLIQGCFAKNGMQLRMISVDKF